MVLHLATDVAFAVGGWLTHLRRTCLAPLPPHSADGGNKWDRDDWGNQHGTAGGKCGQVTRKLDPAALSDDILMGINCFANQTKGKGAGFMSYILTQ